MSEKDVAQGRTRAECALEHLAELNMYVPVSHYKGALTPDAIKTFQV